MNRENVLKLANHMARIRHEEHYDQQVWGVQRGCGVAACLAGHAVLLFDGPKAFRAHMLDTRENDPWLIQRRATELLDLNAIETRVLFSSDGFSWPSQFANRWDRRYRNAKRIGKDATRRPSRIAADMLRWIVKHWTEDRPDAQ